MSVNTLVIIEGRRTNIGVFLFVLQLVLFGIASQHVNLWRVQFVESGKSDLWKVQFVEGSICGNSDLWKVEILICGKWKV